MKIKDIARLLDAKVCVGADLLEHPVYAGCAADLMSDVLAFGQEGTLLLTGLVNPQVVRTADMMDIKCVVFVRGKQPGKDVIDLALERGVAILSTPDTMYIACGKLYAGGLTV